MFIFCTSCNTDVEPGIVKDTLVNKQVTNDTKAVCPECRAEINLSTYMMKSLVSMGRYDVAPRAEKSFSFPCSACEKSKQAVLSKDKKKALCETCGEQLNISPYMIKAISLAKSGDV